MPKRWAIQVVTTHGDVMYLRHGNKMGVGPVATFGTRKLADINREFIEQGMGMGEVVTVIEFPKGAAPPQEPTP